MEITLHPLSCEDKDTMLDILTNQEVAKTYMLPDFETREAALPLFHRLVELSQAEKRYVRGICLEGSLIGFLNDVEIANGTMELGYVLHPEHWGKGYMTQALRTAISDLFRLGYSTVLCGAFSHNKASLRVMEKAGMRKTEKTEDIEYRGKVHPCVYYAIEK